MKNSILIDCASTAEWTTVSESVDVVFGKQRANIMESL